jgi:hypothetical protein
MLKPLGGAMQSHHARTEWPGNAVVEAAIAQIAMWDVAECRVSDSMICTSARAHLGFYISGAGGVV